MFCLLCVLWGLITSESLVTSRPKTWYYPVLHGFLRFPKCELYLSVYYYIRSQVLHCKMLAHNALSTGSNIRICYLDAHLFCHLFFFNFPNNKQSHGNITIGWGFSLYHLSHNIAQTQTEKKRKFSLIQFRICSVCVQRSTSIGWIRYVLRSLVSWTELSTRVLTSAYISAINVSVI